MDSLNGGANGKPTRQTNQKQKPQIGQLVSSEMNLPLTSRDMALREPRESTRDLASREAIWQGNMRQDRDLIEERFAQAEADLRHLTSTVVELREQLEKGRHQEQSGLKEDYEVLKKAVLDYVIACGAVDVQVALFRARGDVAGEVLENLRRSLELQKNAFEVLRTMAPSLKSSDSSYRD